MADSRGPNACDYVLFRARSGAWPVHYFFVSRNVQFSNGNGTKIIESVSIKHSTSFIAVNFEQQFYTGGKILERFLRSARFNRVKSMNFFPLELWYNLSIISFSFLRIERILLFEVWELKLKCCKLTNQFVIYKSIWFKFI